MKPKKFLVTSALPYANASLHIGHIFESVITDIWVRFQVNHGNECHYFCASDAHGTPVMLKAEELGISPEQHIQNIQKEHLKSYSKYLINFSNFYSTHSDENKTFSEEIYQLAQNNGLIYKKEIEQFFDSEKLMFLSDRFIKGICPQCGAEDQYGDSCGACGATYSPQDLVKPKSTLTNTDPILKTTEHIFFKLPEKTEFLKNFIKNLEIQIPVKNKLKEWTSNMLKDWDISRDSPYFGFKIPNEQDKYFYVWLDAPIGYFASIKDWANKHSFNLEDIINSDSEYELIHFIGKDISYFHALFWPALLDCTHYLQPSQINVHGFLTINGEKIALFRHLNSVYAMTTQCPHPVIFRGPLTITQDRNFVLFANLGILLCSTTTKKSLFRKIGHVFKVPCKTPHQETENFQCMNVLIFRTHGK